jgi:hypothetical protein
VAIDGKNSKPKDLRENLPRGSAANEAPSLSNATLRTLSTATLEKLKDSVIENMGALQFLLAREEALKKHLRAHQELLRDCRVIIEAHGHKALVKKIDKAIEETYV